MGPGSLLRNDSTREQQEFAAPANNIRQEDLDCGITAIPCCLPLCCKRFATPKIFLTFFVILGIIQGSAQAYFSATARHIGSVFNYSNETIDWILVVNEISQGVFVLFVAHWGNKIHRIAWLGGLTCFQGLSCFLVFIPYLEHKNNGNTTLLLQNSSPNLCTESIAYQNLETFSNADEYCWITLVVLVILQIFFGLANASFYTHGLSYIDDNVEQINSPIYLASALAVKMSSLQFGSFMAWSFLNKDGSWWIGYPVLGSILIIIGTIVATFPKYLVNTVLKRAAASILNVATGSIDRHLSEIKPKTGFFITFRRLITNKVIIINAIATVFLEMGIKNFAWYEERFMEAQYHLPSANKGFGDPWTSRLTTTILKPPIMTLAMLVTGFIISKAQPRTRCLAIWCVLTTLIVVGACASYGYIDCKKDKIAGEYRGSVTLPYCSQKCKCSEKMIRFNPVCIQDLGGTYYSPCHAGCKNVSYINDLKYYTDCLCGEKQISYVTPHANQATEGACDSSKCTIHWTIFQAVTIISSALLGSGYVTNFMINIRSVYATDKAMAIGFELFLAGIIVHVPGKILYKYVSDKNCLYQGIDKYSCNLHNEQFGKTISYLTAGLLFISVIFDFVIIFISKEVDIFPENDKDDSSIQMQQMARFGSRREIRNGGDSGVVSPNRSSRRSGFSTPASSIEFNSPEEQPLAHEEVNVREQPVNRQQPATREQLHRSVINEMNELIGTTV